MRNKLKQFNIEIFQLFSVTCLIEGGGVIDIKTFMLGI